MKLRRCLALLLVFALLLTLPACDADAGGFRKKDVLRVCIDSVSGSGLSRVMYDFMYSLRQATGIEDVSFEYLPSEGVERETAIQRLRTELMAGGGPDVFLVRCGGGDSALFPFPEKVMEAGFFLPLDDYMENHTNYTDWAQQNPAVLAAGRNDEGQQIIPLHYSCPVQVWPKDKLDAAAPDVPMTFENVLLDPVLSAPYAEFYNLRNIYLQANGGASHGFSQNYLQYLVGQWADFETEELLFTEEELLRTVKAVFALPKDTAPAGAQYEEGELLGMLTNFGQPFTVLPFYSSNGGVAVTVDSIAAINRGTKRPEEAYMFLDFFLREKTQLSSPVYSDFSIEGLQLHRNALREDPAIVEPTLKAESFAELTDLQAQITAVNFKNDLSGDFAKLAMDCWHALESGQPLEALVHEAYEKMQRKVRE